MVNPIASASSPQPVAPSAPADGARPTEAVPATSARPELPTLDRSPVATAASEEVVERAVQEVNERIQGISRDLEFSFDPQTGQSVVRLVDRGTGEVLLQLPSEAALAVSRRLDALSGVFVRQET